MLKRMLLVLALLLATGFTVVACFGGETTDGATDADNGEMDGGDETMAGAELSVITEDAFVFAPAAVSADAGSEVTLTLDNTGGALEHSWVLVPLEMTQEEAVALTDPPPAESILYELRVQPGETNSGTFTAPAEAGSYIVVCAVPGHAAGGMVGSLTVN